MWQKLMVSWAIILTLLALTISSSTKDSPHLLITRKTKIIRVAIVPICNLGLSCDPNLPAHIDRNFFRSPFGVANFIHEISQGNARIIGTTLPWLRAPLRFSSAETLVARTDELLVRAEQRLLAKDFKDFDVFFFYVKIGGISREYFATEKRLITKTHGAPSATIAHMVNTELFEKPANGKVLSAILPSTNWALALLRAIGIGGTTHSLDCDNFVRLSACTMRKANDPYSILGAMAFSLALPSPLGRSVFWSDVSPTPIERDGNYHLDYTQTSKKLLTIALNTPLKLHDSLQFDRLYIEQRHVSPFDRRLRTISAKEFSDASLHLLHDHDYGAFLYLGSSTNETSTLLIDVNRTMATSNFGNRSHWLSELSDSSLTRGHRFKVFESPITIEVTGKTASSLTINVAGISQ